MALIQCPECKKEISDRAETCPSCGCPLAKKAASEKIMPPLPQSVAVVTTTKSRGIYIILGLLLGLLGIHNFYAGYYGRGACQLIITLTLGWLIVGLVITGIWALIEIITVVEDANGNKMT